MKLSNFLDNNPTFAIINSYRQLTRFQKHLMNSFGLNFYQCLIVAGLYFEEGETISPQNLIETLRTTKGTVSQSLAVLEAQKLISIKALKEDRRKQVMKLTKKGEDRAIAIISFFDREQNKLEREVGVDNLQNFIELMSLITKKSSY